ncbi:class I SAM-dependent methyltransferase [Patulibacter sp. NPDC049589]|uniref:SAM-dependent methyltransferase n=1 Tax=Patulibacter sp. NPDC049589 TaxID=3154731 RepID=UPI003420223C
MTTSSHAHDPAPADDPREFWESHYERQRERFRGNPNALALDHLDDLAPGTALELGSGQGADAIWLARRGWTVLAVDLSENALRLAAERADAAGVADRVRWRQHDLGAGVPEGSFDLVLSSYTQSPVGLARVDVLRAAADRVAPGGALLVVGHSGIPSWATVGPPAEEMPDAATLIAALDLPGDAWTVDRRADVQREITDPDGRPATRPDSVVRFRRR